MDKKSLWRMRALLGGLAAWLFGPWSAAVAQEAPPPPAASSSEPPISPTGTVPSTVPGAASATPSLPSASGPPPAFGPPALAQGQPPSAAASSPAPMSGASTDALDAVPPKKTQGLVLDGWIGGGATGVVREDSNTGFIAFGFTGLYHTQWFELGMSFTIQDTVFAFDSAIFSALAGVKTEVMGGVVRYELLAEGGADFVGGVGGGLFANSVDHGSATLPYLGGRAAISYLLGNSHRFVLGAWVSAGDAIGTTVVHPVVSSCFLECSTNTETYTIGGPSWTIGLRIGGEAAVW
jgi:hypothetical protein